MTAPLDEKGYDASIQALLNAFPMADKMAAMYAEVAIRAYLAASPSPSEMEVVAWDRLRDLIGEYFDLGYAEGVVQRDADTMAGDAQRTLSDIEVIISQAQSALAAMGDKLAIAERNRDAGRDNFHTMQQSAADLAAQVLRLTEENEALRKDAGELVVAQYALSAAEARIKALEEALRQIERRTASHPEDDAGDDMRDKKHAHAIARRALSTESQSK